LRTAIDGSASPPQAIAFWRRYPLDGLRPGGDLALLALLGISLFAIASFVVGWRLLWLAHRTGLMPEKLVGGSLLLAGGIGTGLLVLSGFAGPARGVFSTAGLFAIDCGITALAVFTWRVFRPGLLGATMVATCTALLFLAFASDWVSGQYLGVRRSAFSMTGDYVGRFAIYGWASFETLRQYALARRRVRIGLLEPLVANRFLLWGIATLAALGIWGYSLWSELVARSDRTEFYLVASVMGCTCAASIWLAFFPPRPYQQWFAASAPPR
jgi:hypothetical protein